MTKDKGIIFAADIQQESMLLAIAQETCAYIRGVKVGGVALYENGWGLIEKIKRVCPRPVYADLKLMDIPYVAEKLASRAFRHGADGIMVCGACGRDTLSVCRKCAGDKMVFVFTQFTHSSGLITDRMADTYVGVALETGCDGIQVPANRPVRIGKVREWVGDGLKIVSCGIGAQGAPMGSAIKAGADYEIIGRAIYERALAGESPREAAVDACHAAELVDKAMNLLTLS